MELEQLLTAHHVSAINSLEKFNEKYNIPYECSNRVDPCEACIINSLKYLRVDRMFLT